MVEWQIKKSCQILSQYACGQMLAALHVNHLKRIEIFVNLKSSSVGLVKIRLKNVLFVFLNFGNVSVFLGVTEDQERTPRRNLLKLANKRPNELTILESPNQNFGSGHH